MGIPRLNKETSLFRANAIPEYVAGVVTEAKAAIKVTMDQITSEVSRKVGTDEVISRINQSPESVTIDADRLDIATSTDGGDGVLVHPRNDATTGWRISDVLELVRSGVSAFRVWLESGAARVRVGENGQSHMELDYHSLKMYGKENATFFDVMDLRDRSGTVERTETHIVNLQDASEVGGPYVVTVNLGVAEVTALKCEYIGVDGTMYDEATIAEYDFDEPEVVYNRVTVPEHTPPAWPPSGYVEWFIRVTVTYTSTSKNAVALTFGVRNSAWEVGAMSRAHGYDVAASGFDSQAEGMYTRALGDHSSAEGMYSQAKGNYAHSGGYSTTASGDASHAQNRGTIAASDDQTAMGRWNEEDADGKYALVIGNGTGELPQADPLQPVQIDRSNAFAVDWDGIPYARNPNDDFGSIFDLVYPVGAIYMSVTSTSPATLFGGTWERITGRFLLAATDGGAAGGNSNASIAAGNTGGEATHTLTPTETATKNHAHTMDHGHGFTQPTITVKRSQAAASGSATYVPASNGSNTVTNVASASGGKVADHSGSTGGLTAANGSAHNNMPPYLAVYVWKRTA